MSVKGTNILFLLAALAMVLCLLYLYTANHNRVIQYQKMKNEAAQAELLPEMQPRSVDVEGENDEDGGISASEQARALPKESDSLDR